MALEIAVSGYGRMGREISVVAAERGHTVVATIDPGADDAGYATIGEAVAAGVLSADTTIIDFSLARAVEPTVEAAAGTGAAVVIGTTGWDDIRESVLDRAGHAGISLIYGSNFSVGAQLFVRVARRAARLAARAEIYDAALYELHHKGKADSPSGTARTIANALLDELPAKRVSHEETLHRPIEADELHVASLRVGSVPGTHTVVFDSVADSIELTHRARSRGGFAVGAVQAAEWLAEHRGVHAVEEFFADLFGGER